MDNGTDASKAKAPIGWLWILGSALIGAFVATVPVIYAYGERAEKAENAAASVQLLGQAVDHVEAETARHSSAIAVHDQRLATLESSVTSVGQKVDRLAEQERITREELLRAIGTVLAVSRDQRFTAAPRSVGTVGTP